MRLKQFTGTAIDIYSSPTVFVHSLETRGIFCGSIPGFGAGNMVEDDINPDDDTL